MAIVSYIGSTSSANGDGMTVTARFAIDGTQFVEIFEYATIPADAGEYYAPIKGRIEQLQAELDTTYQITCQDGSVLTI